MNDLKTAIERGTKAWADVPSDWVDELRGGAEPVGYVSESGKGAYLLVGVGLEDDTPLYTAPPKREWVGLTEQDVHDAFQFTELIKQLSFDRERPEWCENFAAYLEAKLKEKNV